MHRLQQGYGRATMSKHQVQPKAVTPNRRRQEVLPPYYLRIRKRWLGWVAVQHNNSQLRQQPFTMPELLRRLQAHALQLSLGYKG
jgi:hypothetical protein